MTATTRGVMVKKVQRMDEYLPTSDDDGGHDKSQPEQSRDPSPSLFSTAR
jgi:hypothetical protein